MKSLLLKDILMRRHIKKGKYCVPQKVWHCVYATKLEERYTEALKRMEESGIDFRVRLDPNQRALVYLRKELGHPEHYRMWYGFFVTRHDYKRALKALDVDYRYNLVSPM